MRETLWINPEYEKRLHEAGLSAPSDFLDKGVVVRSVGNKQNVTLKIDGKNGTTEIFLKRHVPDRASLGPRELQNTLKIADLGIPVATPIAAGACSKGSFFASLGIEGGIPLDDWVRSQGAPPRKGLAREARNFLISEVATITRKLHDAGLCHRDLYLCHFFLVPGESHRLLLIDNQRVRRTTPLRRRWIVKDLAALHYSSPPPLCTTSDRCRFMRDYLEVQKLGGRARRLAAAVTRKSARVARHESRKASGRGCKADGSG